MVRCDRRAGVRTVVRRVHRPVVLNGAAALADGRVVYDESLPPHRRGFRARIIVRAPGGPAEEVDRGRITSLAVEDGVTLRWENAEAGAGWRFRDLAPPPVRDGCPARSLYAPLAEGEGILVTRAEYDEGTDVYGGRVARTVVRACARGSGRDAVVAGGWRGWGYSTRVEVLRFEPGAVVFLIRTGDKYGRDEDREVRVEVR